MRYAIHLLGSFTSTGGKKKKTNYCFILTQDFLYRVQYYLNSQYLSHSCFIPKYYLFLFSFLKKGRLPYAALYLVVSGDLEAPLPYILLQINLASLSGGSSRKHSHLYTLDRRIVFLYQGRLSSSKGVQLGGGNKWSCGGRRGLPPNQPDQPNHWGDRCGDQIASHPKILPIL